MKWRHKIVHPPSNTELRKKKIHCFFCFFLSCPLSDSCPESDSESLDELLLELESLELSLAWPDLLCVSTISATLASSGSYFRSCLYHFLDSLGLPRAVLCQTTGKLVLDAKFCVTAMVVSRLSTTCQIPPLINCISLYLSYEKYLRRRGYLLHCFLVWFWNSTRIIFVFGHYGDKGQKLEIIFSLLFSCKD